MQNYYLIGFVSKDIEFISELSCAFMQNNSRSNTFTQTFNSFQNNSPEKIARIQISFVASTKGFHFKIVTYLAVTRISFKGETFGGLHEVMVQNWVTLTLCGRIHDVSADICVYWLRGWPCIAHFLLWNYNPLMRWTVSHLGLSLLRGFNRSGITCDTWLRCNTQKQLTYLTNYFW